jgi:pimeloyl-ACP methyl ester carboxylesterase
MTEHALLRAEVERAFRSLPDRYLGGGGAGYRIQLGDLGRIWEVRVDEHAARVTNGTTRREPDVTFSTDAETWLALRRGEFSGIDAFNAGRLHVSGHLDHAIAFESLFRLPNGRPPLLQVRRVPAGRVHISTLTMGERSTGSDILLLHGLGATRASMLSLAARLSHHHRVHAIDLPGFGSSSKPARGRYSAPWFAEIVFELMDELDLDRAHLVGNSMGGRIAIEMGLTRPDRVRSLGLLSPAVAWIRRDFHRVVRLLRPEFGFLPHAFTRKRVSGTFWGIFNDLDAVDPELGDLIVDEFLRIYHAPGARHAFLASARNIYLDDPRGFYPRLASLQAPALFIWGGCDPLVPAAFSRHVAQRLPQAEQVTLEGCGHVPQVERPDETLVLLRKLIARADRTSAHLESAHDAAARSRRQSAA